MGLLKGRLLLTFVLFIVSFAASSQGVISSNASGKWESTSTWSCSCVPNATDDVKIYHTINIDNTTGNAFANSVTIENSGSASAILNVKSAAKLTVSNDVAINGKSNAYAAELNVSNTAQVIVSGSVALTRDQSYSSRSRIRLTNTASLKVSRDLTLTYLDQTTTTETDYELSIGTTSGDAPVLDVGGDLILIFNSLSDNTLSILADNSSTVKVGGDLEMQMIDGGTSNGGRIQVATNTNATLDVTGTIYFNYSDTQPRSDQEIALTLNGSSVVTTGALTMVAYVTTSSINNYLRTYSSSHLLVKGTLSYTASTPTASVDNRIEVNDNSLVELQGDIINRNEGSFEFFSTGTLKLNGTVSQTMPYIKSGTTVKNFIYDNSSGIPLRLASPVTIGLALTLSNGIIESSSTNTLILADGATTSGAGSSTSYITGPVKKLGGTSANDVTFPIGDGSVWAPVKIAGISGADNTTTITVRYFASPYSNLTTDGTFSHVSGEEYWDVAVSGTVPTLNLTLYWKDACRSGIYDIASGDLTVGHFNSSAGTWSRITSAVDAGSAICDAYTAAGEIGSITANGVNSFSPFTFVSQNNFNTLPVTLIAFEGETTEEGQVLLSWETASEINSNYFIIEHSPDGKSFRELARREGAGSAVGVHYYTLVDPTPVGGHNYYRLSQVDLDATRVILDVIHVNVDRHDPQVQLYPNPAKLNEPINILTDSEETLTCQIFSQGGQLIGEFRLERPFTIRPHSTLQPGVYFIMIHSASKRSLKAFTITE